MVRSYLCPSKQEVQQAHDIFKTKLLQHTPQCEFCNKRNCGSRYELRVELADDTSFFEVCDHCVELSNDDMIEHFERLMELDNPERIQRVTVTELDQNDSIKGFHLRMLTL